MVVHNTYYAYVSCFTARHLHYYIVMLGKGNGEVIGRWEQFSLSVSNCWEERPCV